MEPALVTMGILPNYIKGIIGVILLSLQIKKLQQLARNAEVRAQKLTNYSLSLSFN
jgi:hypothetical protein